MLLDLVSSILTRDQISLMGGGGGWGFLCLNQGKIFVQSTDLCIIKKLLEHVIMGIIMFMMNEFYIPLYQERLFVFPTFIEGLPPKL